MSSQTWSEDEADYGDPNSLATLQRWLGYDDPLPGLEVHKKIMAAFRRSGTFLPTRAELLAAYQEELK
jgi:hypothetical protein